MPRRLLALTAAAALAVVLVPGSIAIAKPAATADDHARVRSAPDGALALSGARAEAYRLPDDVARQWTARFADGSTQTRYQQVVRGADVLGGQVTVLRDAEGVATAVVGAHYAGLAPTNALRLAPADALATARQTVGSRGDRSASLRIDPRHGRLFYAVETQRFSSRWTLWVDATTGAIRNRYEAVTEGRGIGIKGDRKSIDTTKAGGTWRLISRDRRQKTYDAGNQTTLPGTLMTDPDNVWDLSQPSTVSPSQAAGVDAHYYANVVDDFYGDTFSRNSIDDAGMTIISSVHYDVGYCNAFWNGEQMTYGDGDGAACKPLSGGLDVVGHELTHGVTEFTSGLIYENESGALNESFSDMIGNTIEFYADARNLDRTVEPDWLIGEDVIPAGAYGGTTPGFRNMGDPQDDGDPDHYSERYMGTDDNGGVHTNSGIPNHAYYLAVNGGRNAGCDAAGSGGHTHTADCAVTVPAIGVDRAAQIFYTGFTSLTDYANFCDARNATVAVAGTARPSVNKAWAAVGVRQGCTPGVPPPPPCVGDDTASIPFESPHPYGNNGDCTWRFDNGSPGFAFHFDQLETESGFDYVIIYNGRGQELTRYDGTHPLPGGVTTPCIGTRFGSVRLLTDAGVVDEGFHVDAVESC